MGAAGAAGAGCAAFRLRAATGGAGGGLNFLSAVSNRHNDQKLEGGVPASADTGDTHDNYPQNRAGCESGWRTRR